MLYDMEREKVTLGVLGMAIAMLQLIWHNTCWASRVSFVVESKRDAVVSYIY